jgi:acyl-CoA reductase-like NAD-dependent aldehyde dehydrogenase
MNQLAIHNPATGALITNVDADDAASVALKAGRARAAQAAWAATPLVARKACIERFAAAVRAELEPLAAIMTRETGKPIKMSHNELNGLMGRIDFFLSAVDASLVTETVFAWPGVGRALVSAVSARDLAVVQGVLLMTAFTMVIANLLVDLAYGWIDPRIRAAKSRPSGA